MSKLLWVFQIAVGAMFVMAGGMKVMNGQEGLVAMGMAWANAVPAWMIGFIGFSEILGGLGLVLPSAFRIAPKLTPLSAALLTLVMVMAAMVHVIRAEYSSIVMNAMLGMATAFIVWGRGFGYPIRSKSLEAEEKRFCEGC